ncbi:hypothetical protein [Roseibium sediminis]|uniref:hypothetical protein n=1 Tax=Roseibium sediminis TaxID=1775174 RepID=UPI00123E29BC|nr:hypothetical protein [Roseibium sediminis]
MTKICSQCGGVTAVTSEVCPKCEAYLKGGKRNFGLSVGALFIFVIALLVSFNFANVSELFSNASLKDNLVSFTMTSPPEFFAHVSDYNDGQGAASVVAYHVKLPVVVRNRSDSVLSLSQIVVSVKDGRAEKPLKNFPEYSQVEANSTFARDVWVPVWMSKYDPAANGWILPKIEYGQSLFENFGKADVSLYAEDERGRGFEVGQQSFEIGKVALQVIPQ